jgi:peptidoglycan/xylan/chitin deacetylase (PgdA/CDA1 family)
MILRKNIIATFHDVKDIDWFDETIKYFSENYRMVNTNELYDLMSKGAKFKNIAHITVDDGISSFYHTIFPVLKKYQVPATLFVSPKIITQQKNFWFQEDKNLEKDLMIKIISAELKLPENALKNMPYHYILKSLKISEIQRILSRYYLESNKKPLPYLNITLEQLKEIDQSGIVTIGGHTMNHPILANETYEVAKYEIMECLNELEKLLQHPIEYFAYPNGLPTLDFGEREMKILKDAKVKLAFSGEFGQLTVRNNKMSIPRMGFSKGTKNSIRLKILLGKYWLILKGFKSSGEEKIRINRCDF